MIVGREGVVMVVCGGKKIYKKLQQKKSRRSLIKWFGCGFVGFTCLFFYWFTSDLARFLPPSFPLLALGVIIASRPARMKLHVDLALFAS